MTQNMQAPAHFVSAGVNIKRVIIFSGLFTGHDPTRGSGQSVLKSHESGRIGRVEGSFPNLTGGIESGRMSPAESLRTRFDPTRPDPT